MAVVQRPLNGRWRKTQQVSRSTSLPLLNLVATMLFLVALALLVQRGLELGERKLNDWRYGFPRAASVTIVDGSDAGRGPTWWVQTINLNGQISILAIPNGDATQMQALAGPYLVGYQSIYEVAVPTLRDVNGDGQVDLMVTIRGEVFVYLNDAGTLRPISVEERAMLVGANRDL